MEIKEIFFIVFFIYKKYYFLYNELKNLIALSNAIFGDLEVLLSLLVTGYENLFTVR
jgi:hypothetical protein